MSNAMKNLKRLLAEIYEIENPGSRFDFNWKRIDPEKETEFSRITEALKELKHRYIRTAGIESL